MASDSIDLLQRVLVGIVRLAERTRLERMFLEEILDHLSRISLDSGQVRGSRDEHWNLHARYCALSVASTPVGTTGVMMMRQQRCSALVASRPTQVGTHGSEHLPPQPLEPIRGFGTELAKAYSGR